jgi:hypothetical protein
MSLLHSWNFPRMRPPMSTTQSFCDCTPSGESKHEKWMWCAFIQARTFHDAMRLVASLRLHAFLKSDRSCAGLRWLGLGHGPQ